MKGQINIFDYLENGAAIYNTPSGDPVKWENNRREVLKKLAEYEDLEEQGKLLKLPCAVGDTIYVIPSKTNYKLNIVNDHEENNRVYEQVVNHIEIFETGYLLSTCDGMESVIERYYKETWFLTKEEAESALKAMSE